MKKKTMLMMLFILGVLFVPKIVLAEPVINTEEETAKFTVCQSGCDYVNLDDLFNTLQDDVFDGFSVSIDFRDSTEHKLLNHDLSNLDFINFNSSNNSNINVSGYSDAVQIKVNGIFVGTSPLFEYNFKLADIQIIQSSGITDFCDSDGNCFALSILSNAYIDNVVISAYTNGLELVRGYQYTINGYEYKGKGIGIEVAGVFGNSFPERSININKSKIGNCACSLVVYDEFGESGGTAPKKGLEFPGAKVKSGELFRKIANVINYNVKVDSSEINCVKYGAYNSSFATNPTIYVTSNNTWLSQIKRSKDNNMDMNSLYNVVEGFNSKIIIDQATNITLKMSEEGDLQSYFNELKDVDPSLISWSVEDASILKIVNGKAIPLKLGSTNVTATYKNSNYTINFKITSLMSDITNPKTGSTLLLIVGLMVLISALESVKFFQHSK